jgi:pantoate--beta-alanine ligase
MIFAESVDSIREAVRSWRKNGERVALVPTMGSLHEGHLRLVDQAHANAERVVVSIFVNPLQFGPNEDFSRYPRTLAADRALLTTRGADALFHPSVDTIYPAGFDTTVRAGKLAESLCGPFRPGHFDGVLTVVLKLFTIVEPDLAVFGEKDFQQLRLVETMARDFALPLEVVRAPTVRESDGLAMSSRNRYFDTVGREGAAVLPRALEVAVRVAREPDATAGHVVEPLTATLREAGMTDEYVTVAQEDDLVPVSPAAIVATLHRPRLFVAARHAGVRLIDNRALHAEPERSEPSTATSLSRGRR